MPGAFLGTEIKKINMTWVSCMDGHLHQGHEIQLLKEIKRIAFYGKLFKRGLFYWTFHENLTIVIQAPGQLIYFLLHLTQNYLCFPEIPFTYSRNLNLYKMLHKLFIEGRV